MGVLFFCVYVATVDNGITGNALLKTAPLILPVVDKSLGDLGLNSLQLLAFRNTIQAQFTVVNDDQVLTIDGLDFWTLHEIADFLEANDGFIQSPSQTISSVDQRAVLPCLIPESLPKSIELCIPERDYRYCSS